MTIEPSIVATTISLTASAAAVAPGQSFNLKAEVSAVGSAAPVTGSATLYLGQTVLGTVNIAAGTGVVQTQVPLAGTYSASAVFARQGSFLASKGQPVSFTVEAPASLLPPAGPASSGTFSLGLSSNAVSLNSERTASMQVMVAGLHGYTGNVQLSCAGLPNALSCSFSPSRLGVSAASATSTLFLGGTNKYGLQFANASQYNTGTVTSMGFSWGCRSPCRKNALARSLAPICLALPRTAWSRRWLDRMRLDRQYGYPAPRRECHSDWRQPARRQPPLL